MRVRALFVICVCVYAPWYFVQSPVQRTKCSEYIYLHNAFGQLSQRRRRVMMVMMMAMVMLMVL